MYALMDRLARALALTGGLVLTALIVLTCVSILGRSLNTVLHLAAVQAMAPGLAETLLAAGVGPVNGDFELVEAGMAFAIFAFLPLCQLNGAHASVDVFTSMLPKAANRALQAGIETVFAAILVLIAWQLYLGMISKMDSGQTTFLIQFPVWWAYAAAFGASAIAALTGIYMAGVRLVEAATGAEIAEDDAEPEH